LGFRKRSGKKGPFEERGSKEKLFRGKKAYKYPDQCRTPRLSTKNGEERDPG